MVKRRSGRRKKNRKSSISKRIENDAPCQDAYARLSALTGFRVSDLKVLSLSEVETYRTEFTRLHMQAKNLRSALENFNG